MRTHSTNTNRSAFTLVEIMIATTIAVMVMGMVMVLFVSSMDGYGTSVGKLYLNGDIRHFAEVLNRDISRACNISVDASGHTAVLTYRDTNGVVNGSVTYTYNSTNNIVSRKDDAINQVTTIAKGIRPLVAGGPLFTGINANSTSFNTIRVTGFVRNFARSRLQPTVANIFEFAVTHQG